jgi:hypothetical protein
VTGSPDAAATELVEALRQSLLLAEGRCLLARRYLRAGRRRNARAQARRALQAYAALPPMVRAGTAPEAGRVEQLRVTSARAAAVCATAAGRSKS